ncbi:pentatricopeptide repeat-containing protein [Senna tora]|uniref:Pentatricopeptide repeat-containing protein n=1 Tax=Senna tora TaxID=362788 RepID=A0A834X351_9FABA|nr:pentatricopeptide repeat-containing protein [Senna tora]
MCFATRMWRWAFARQAFQHLNASRIQIRIPKVSVNTLQSPQSFVCLVPQISGLSMNQRFFSQNSVEPTHSESQIIDSTTEDSIHEVSMHSSACIDEYESANDASLDGGPPAESLEEDGGMEMDDSVSYFEQFGKERDERNWQMLEEVRSILQSSADESFESRLGSLDFHLNDEFVIKLIQTPHVLGENLIRFYRWTQKNYISYRYTTPVLESLALALCSGLKKKEIYSLWDIIMEINKQDNCAVNVEIFNKMIASFSKLGKGKAAFEAFGSLEEFSFKPNADTYYYTIEALCRRSFFDWAWTVSEEMVYTQRIPDADKVGKIISWFCKGINAKAAHAVYVAARENKQHPPKSSINFLIGQLCKDNETVKLALEMLDDIPEEVKKRAINPYSAVVQALCRIKDVDAAKQLILKMIADGPPPGNAVFNYVITGYSKVGEMGQALEMMKLMETRGLKPDVYTYTVVISGYINGGEMEQACNVLTEAKKKHSQLSPVSYHTLIRGYCKLEQYDKALELLAEMKEFGVRPTVDEYEKLIQSLCLKALDWQMAEKLQEEMKENGLYLKGITRALVRAVKEMEKEVLETEKGSLVA